MYAAQSWSRSNLLWRCWPVTLPISDGTGGCRAASRCDHASAGPATDHLAHHGANARDRLIVVDGAFRPVQKSPSFRAIES
jgi:hypothetical protein